MTIQEAGEVLLGTSGERDEAVATALGIPVARLESELVDSGIEKCRGCGLWAEDNVMSGEGFCRDCVDFGEPLPARTCSVQGEDCESCQ